MASARSRAATGQNLFKRYLTNDTYPLRMYTKDLHEATDSVKLYLPGPT